MAGFDISKIGGSISQLQSAENAIGAAASAAAKTAKDAADKKIQDALSSRNSFLSSFPSTPTYDNSKSNSGRSYTSPQGDGTNYGFFQIGNPSTPTIKLQFRTNPNNAVTDYQNTDFSNDNWWEELVDMSNSANAQDFQNYLFRAMELVDESGTQMITLTLTDQNVAELERIIIATTLMDQAANANANTDAINEVSSTGGWTRYYNGTTKNYHIRLRFGYDQDMKSTWSDNFIDDSSPTDGGWSTRNNYPNKTVVMTPWLYFMIQDITTKYEYDKGLTAEIKAFSVGLNTFDKFRIIQQYAIVQGISVRVLHDLFSNDPDNGDVLGGSICKGFNTDPKKPVIKFSYKDFDGKIVDISKGNEIPAFNKGYVDRQGKKIEIDKWPAMEISLGHQPSTNSYGIYQLEYKTIREILEDFCTKAPRKNMKQGSTEPVPTIIDLDPTAGDTSSGTIDSSNSNSQSVDYYSVPLHFQIDDRTDPNIQQVIFYYPDTQVQDLFRFYEFYGTGFSVIKNVSITGMVSMWAQLNMPFVIKNSRGEVSVSVTGKVEYAKTNNNISGTPISSNANTQNDVIKSYVGIKDGAPIFSGNFDGTQVMVAGGSLSTGKNSGDIAQALVNNINQQLFKGTIEILGDPFYLFDTNINPYFYMIYLKINKPDYIKKDGSFQPSLVSPATGYYTVNKITHRVDAGGFTTVLDIMKSLPVN